MLLGERIPITLEFSSGSPDKYKLNGATYDRSGRLPTQEFIPDREDVTDPYQDYLGSGVLGGIAGGLRGYPVLESKPHSIDLELNDWFRFDRPGRYHMYLKSHRLTRERLPGEAGEKPFSLRRYPTSFRLKYCRRTRAGKRQSWLSCKRFSTNRNRSVQARRAAGFIQST